mmetsp:Transcript_41975/g.103531  ORF Transcript_41975/g.103531 Transcript_41975/m.103531 type:complete len:81 (+) Transcript_41975:46-288(+)
MVIIIGTFRPCLLNGWETPILSGDEDWRNHESSADGSGDEEERTADEHPDGIADDDNLLADHSSDDGEDDVGAQPSEVAC